MTIKIFLHISILCLLILCSSCSTTPITVNYYTLNNIETSASSSKNKGEDHLQPLILISPIVLADFLTTGALVMQLESHKIQLSNQHRWAHNLSEAIAINLLKKLSITTTTHQFELPNYHWQSDVQAHLKIRVEQFIVTADQHTLIAGSFWLLDNNKRLVKKQAFEIRKTLNHAGYNHAVAQLESSLSVLAEQIRNLILTARVI